jgi:hypothetical protein
LSASFFEISFSQVFGMDVIECDVPSSSALSRELIRNAHFHDSYRAPLARPELRIVEIFFALFGLLRSG